MSMKKQDMHTLMGTNKQAHTYTLTTHTTPSPLLLSLSLSLLYCKRKYAHASLTGYGICVSS